MTNTDRPQLGTPEFEAWLRKRSKETAEELFNGTPADLEELGVISGSIKSLTNTDSEAFPDELEEYKPEESKIRPVK